jgi:uncharacterized membrane protein YGL010W
LRCHSRSRPIPREFAIKSLSENLGQYAAYHRNARNRATHYIGIPLIVVALVVLLSRPQLDLGDVRLSPAAIGVAAAIVYYFLLDAGLAALMAVAMGLALWFGAWVALSGTHAWLSLGLGGFVAGWALQFLGHYFEGRKPAFIDDLVGLLIGPLFVLAEALFALGFYRTLRAEVEARVRR